VPRCGTAVIAACALGLLGPTGCADDAAPTWPDGAAVAASDVAMDELTLTWPEAVDEEGIGGYRLLRSGQPERLFAVDHRTITLSGLAPGSSVDAEVVAVDRAGNRSAPISISVRTLDGPVRPPVPAPQGIRAALGGHVGDGGAPLSLDPDQRLDGPEPVRSTTALPTDGLEWGAAESAGTSGILSRTPNAQGAADDDVGEDSSRSPDAVEEPDAADPP
jgi:hypothetical protein